MADRTAIEQEFQRRLEAVKRSHAKFAFDREGRPGATAAVRAALPTVERELFDAVIEDWECEIAATRETFLQILENVGRA